MADNLVIVESPAKAKTIKKYLGKDFEVLASYGHVRDLVPKEGAVNPDKHFAMSYQSIERNEKHVDAIARALKKSKNLYLATDPDREGEAISWHLRELLNERGDLKGKDVKRVVFYEITKGEVQRAVAEPRDLSLDLVNAQQARRALDYLVGFNLSPLLWKKVRRGLSAGRVQSPALRMICEREHEISIFKPQEYWTLEAEGEHSTQTFPLKLVEFDGKKVEQFSFTDEAAARGVEQSIKDASQGFLHVISIERKQRRRNPSPPFTTSTLQQEAARKLGYSAQRTMRLAQQLYEGVDFGEGSIGLITYMRTDSREPRGRSGARDARGHRARIRQGSRVRRAARLQDEVAQRAGSPRGHPPHVGGHPAVARRRQDRSGSVQAVRAHLEARRGLADGARAVRHRGRGHDAEQACGGRRDACCQSTRAARQRLHAHQARLHGGVPGRRRRRQTRERKRSNPAGHEGRRRGHLAEPAQRPALHRAAAALLGSLAGQGAGRTRHRPAFDLRHHHLDAQGSRVRRHGQSAFHSHRHRQDRRQLPFQAFPQVRGIRLHGRRSKTSSTRCRAAKRTGPSR